MRIIAALSTLPLLTVGYTWGQEAPSSGLLYNVKETSSLTYQCSRVSGGGIECEFNQTAVRRKAKPSELESALKKAREEFRSGINLTNEECQSYQQILDVLEGRAKPPKQPPRPLTALEKKDYSAATRALLSLCKSKTEQNFLAFVRINHDRETRTCSVSSNSFKQRFRQITDLNATKPTWVVAQDGPEGPCGLVNLSRFDLDKTTTGISFWTYTAKRATTNPGGTLLLGASCKALDEDEYLYDWKSLEHPLGCDYINFSVL